MQKKETAVFKDFPSARKFSIKTLFSREYLIVGWYYYWRVGAVLFIHNYLISRLMLFIKPPSIVIIIEFYVVAILLSNYIGKNAIKKHYGISIAWFMGLVIFPFIFIINLILKTVLTVLTILLTITPPDILLTLTVTLSIFTQIVQLVAGGWIIHLLLELFLTKSKKPKELQKKEEQ